MTTADLVQLSRICGPEVSVADSGVLREFCEVVTGQALAHELNLH